MVPVTAIVAVVVAIVDLAADYVRKLTDNRYPG
jgi:hypothetical protein